MVPDQAKNVQNALKMGFGQKDLGVKVLNMSVELNEAQ